MAVRMRFIGVWAVLLLSYATAARADDESSSKTTNKQQPSAQQIAQWAGRLGDAKFAVREEASLRLLEAGLAAREELLKRINSSDPEVRDRARRILASINERIHRQRVAAFLADPDDTKKHALAGWPRFVKVVGNDVRSRKLFVQLHEEEPALLDALDGDAARLNEQFVSRNRELQAALQRRQAIGLSSANRQTPLAVAAAVIFVASDPRISLDNSGTFSLYNLIFQSTLRQQIQSGGAESPYRKLVAALISRDVGSNNVYPSFMVAIQLNMPEALPAAVRLLQKPDPGSSTTQLYAMLIVGRFGERKHVKLMEPLLKNEATCWTFQRGKDRFTTQVRDAALAATIHLSGAKPGDYGFSLLQTNQQMFVSPYTLGFANDAARKQAIEKWKNRSTPDTEEREEK